MTQKKKLKNRWLVALSGVALHLSIGSAYAWSIFTKPIQEVTNWKASQISFAFSIAIFCLGFSAAFMGRYTDKYGPRVTGTISSIFFGLGIALTGVAITIESLPMLYLSYGLIAGIGLGTGYVTPVSTMMAWFPDRRGLATGMAIMGFGFATLVTTPIAEALMNASNIGLSKTFYILGAAYFVIMFLASQYIEKPPVGWKPKGYQEEAPSDSNTQTTGNSSDIVELTAAEALKTKRFWMLWLMLFINITCGIALVSSASPMAQKVTGMSTGLAATMVAIMGIFNGGGRFVWATVSDYLGRANVFTAYFIIDIVALTLLYFTKSPIVFSILICIVMTCYGGGFSAVPAFISDIFGTKAVASIHGYILTAWAMAGMAGPLILSFTADKTGSYSSAIIIFITMSAIALILSFLIRADIKKSMVPQTSK